MSSGEKGVMLCERPGPSALDTSPGLKPFLPSSSPSNLEPLGMLPSHKVYPPSLAPKQVSATSKSRAFVRDLEQENRQLALAEEERRMADAAKAENVTAFNAQLRTAILTGEDVTFWRPAKKMEEVKQSLEASQAAWTAGGSGGSGGGAGPQEHVRRQALASDVNGFVDAVVGEVSQRLANTSKTAMVSFVDDIVKEAAGAMDEGGGGGEAAAEARGDGTAQASTSSGGGGGDGSKRMGGGGCSRRVRVAAGGGGAGGKPAWALSADQVTRLEAAEEEELLKFTDELDFESFMSSLDDPELQESVQAMRGAGDGKGGPAAGQERAWRQNLVRAMNHVAMQQVAAARRAAGGDDDDDVGSMAAMSEGGASAISRGTATSRLKSEAAAAKRAALVDGGGGRGGGGEGAWDTSSRAAEDVGRMERAKQAATEAAEFLRENPELRAVHSPASVRALISKTEAATAGGGGGGGGVGGGRAGGGGVSGGGVGGSPLAVAGVP